MFALAIILFLYFFLIFCSIVIHFCKNVICNVMYSWNLFLYLRHYKLSLHLHGDVIYFVLMSLAINNIKNCTQIISIRLIKRFSIRKMELVRSVWRKSSFIYKSGVHCVSLRHSGTTTSNVAEVAVFSRDGDSGLTITDAGDTKPKDDMIFNALGVTDELSSYIGLAREFACDGKVEHPYVDKLKRVQMILFDLSHAISKSVPGKTRSFETKHTKDLEEWILEYANQLPPPEDYIIPGGGKACASLHVARTVCRRAERSITTLVRDGALDKEAQTYLNRLSDFLLTVSRIAAKCDQRTENIYIPRAEVTEEK